MRKKEEKTQIAITTNERGNTVTNPKYFEGKKGIMSNFMPINLKS